MAVFGDLLLLIILECSTIHAADHRSSGITHMAYQCGPCRCEQQPHELTLALCTGSEITAVPRNLPPNITHL